MVNSKVEEKLKKEPKSYTYIIAVIVIVLGLLVWSAMSIKKGDHHPGEPVGEVEHATGHVGRVFTQAVTDHHGGRSRERHQPAELSHARDKDRTLHSLDRKSVV